MLVGREYNGQEGFTLVELAIVMIIIGLLIGGVLKGQELIENAKVKRVVSDVKSYQAALNAFEDIYGALPGDMMNATSRIKGCEAPCVDGNGSNFFEEPSHSYAYQAWMHVPATIGSEQAQFWRHLALANLITGVDPQATATAWGETHPPSPIAGGYHVRSAISPGRGSMNGIVIVLRNQIGGEWTCGGGGGIGATCAVSPKMGARIDRIWDDGVADSGSVQAVSANWASGCGIRNSGTNGPTGYDESNDRRVCEIIFNIGN